MVPCACCGEHPGTEPVRVPVDTEGTVTASAMWCAPCVSALSFQFD